MKARRFRRATPGLVLSVMAMLATVPAAAGATDETTSTAETLKQELSILDALDSYVFEARQAESTAARTAGYLQAAMARLEKATSELAVATGEFEASRKRLADTIRIGRLTADYGVFESVFIPDRNLESTRRKMLVRKMAARQADDLAIMTAAHQKAVAMEFVAGMERAQAWVLARVSQDALAKLQADTEARRSLLNRIESDIKMYRRRAAELSDAEMSMVRIIQARLSDRNGPVNFDAHKGSMPLPIADGVVKVPFGDVVHPRFKTVTPHPGWTITHDSRGPRNVRNIAFGRVVWTGRMRGFGTTVVVDHASGWYSVYAGLSTLKVSDGEVVRQGQVLAQVQAAPGDLEVTMYFELRKGSVAIDPADYVSQPDPPGGKP